MPNGDFTKHGLLAGDAAPPHSADWTINQDWEKYTAAEHATWRTLYERQAKLLYRLLDFRRYGRGLVNGAVLVLLPLEAPVPAAGFVLLAAAAGARSVAGKLLVGHGSTLSRGRLPSLIVAVDPPACRDVLRT